MIKDLTSDDILEIIVISNEGQIKLMDGSNGDILAEKTISKLEQIDFFGEIPNKKEDATYMIVYEEGEEGEEGRSGTSHSLKIEEDDISEIWSRSSENAGLVLILNNDFNEDGVNEIMVVEDITPFLSTNQVNRYTILNPLDQEEEFGVINTDFRADKGIPIEDLDGDGEDDIIFTSHNAIFALAVKSPLPAFLAPEFPAGIPLFILLCAMLAFGIIILILKARKLNFKVKKTIKENKITFIALIIALTLMTLTVSLFVSLLSVFNTTLVLGYLMSEIMISFLIVAILWYGLLPLTAAVYNHFAPRFAYFFIKLREMFFSITKSSYHEIIVTDMKGREELGKVNQIKRVILPLLLSIAIGFYSYNNFAVILGYPTSFETFGSGAFFRFMVGYMLLCTLPMLIAFILFSFIIAGNFLLDDAGIVYYAESKKHRKPADIEPISIWAQSMIKGIAGLSAILTMVEFFQTVDFSGFFQEDIMMAVFGAFLVISLFYGLPFFTSFAYILLANDVMDFKHEENSQKLYKIMEKHGFDTTKRDIVNLFPQGSPYKASIEEKSSADRKSKF